VGSKRATEVQTIALVMMKGTEFVSQSAESFVLDAGLCKQIVVLLVLSVTSLCMIHFG
jgi:hypothetical protein